MKYRTPAPPGKIAIPEGIGQEVTQREKLEKLAVQGVLGSLPERLVWAWLLRSGLMFSAQQSEFGGRRMQGGMVLDFIVYGIAAYPVAIRIQGDYWHSPQAPGAPHRDDDSAARLRAGGYLVLDLWEGDVYAAALGEGIGLLVMRELAR
jgi:G:T-mismatch repair DNA endonuclease (very short patch repair protein)